MPTKRVSPERKEEVRQMRLKNLRPLDTLSPEEAHEIRSRGGKARVAQMRERKKMQESLSDMLNMSPRDPHLRAELKKMGFSNAEMTNQLAILINMIRIASSGAKSNVQAATFVRDTVGDKPVDKQVQVQTDLEKYLSIVEDEKEF